LPPELSRLAYATAVVAFFHAVLPTHWLPFALVGRAQRWSAARRAVITAAAAAGHAAVTGGVGLLAAALGLAVHGRFEAYASRVGSGVLIAFGLLYVILDLRHLGHRRMHHVHDGTVHDVAHHVVLSDRSAIASLVLLLSVSPCIALIPIFLQTGRLGVRAALFVMGVNGAVTIVAMVLVAGLVGLGLERLRLERLERYERALVGLLIAGLGVISLAEAHSHGAGAGPPGPVPP